MKKAQGLPLSTIIIAALGLIVLVVLFAIFTGRMAWFTKNISSCPGACMTADECKATEGGRSLGPKLVNPENSAKTCNGASASNPNDQGSSDLICCTLPKIV